MCQINYGSEERATVWNESFPIARLRHWCCACGSNIYAGEKYLRLGTVSDGRGATAKVCLACHDVMVRFRDEHGVMPYPTLLAETLAECVRDSDNGDVWLVDLAMMRVRNSEAA